MLNFENVQALNNWLALNGIDVSAWGHGEPRAPKWPT